MSELVPKGWSAISIREVANPEDRYSFTGGPFGSNLKNEDYTETGVRIIQLQNIGDGRFLNKYKIYTSNEKADELKSCNIYPNDIILSKMGDPVARATIIPSFHNRYLMASDGIRLSIDKLRFDTKFIHDVINSNYFRGQAELNSTGTTRKRIGLTELRELSLLAPPLPEQQKIATILTSVDEVIEKTEAQINKLQDLKKGMMQELLTKGVGTNGVPHTEFKDSPVGRIPKGWEVAKTGEVARSIVPGRNKPKSLDGDIPWITISDIDGLYLNESKSGLGVARQVLSEAGGKTVPKDSVIMTVVGEFGVSAIANRELVINQQLHGFICSEKIYPAFLCLWLRFQKHQIEKLATQTTISYVNKENAESVFLPLPPVNEQVEISNSIIGTDNLIKKRESKLRSLTGLKKALMQDLLTGKVRVKINQNEKEAVMG